MDMAFLLILLQLMESDCVTINKIDSYAINFIFVYLCWNFNSKHILYADWHLDDTHTHARTHVFDTDSLTHCAHFHHMKIRTFILMVNYVCRHLFVSLTHSK